MNPQGVILPNVDESAESWFQRENRRAIERDKILRSRYFLVNIRHGLAGEIWRCTRCGGKHSYLTWMCIEQPFSGITGGLYAFWSQYNPQTTTKFLSDDGVSHYKEITRALLTRRDGTLMPSLSQMHPREAARFGTRDSDIDIGGLALGVLEPLKAVEAQALLDRINSRGGHLAVDGLRGG